MPIGPILMHVDLRAFIGISRKVSSISTRRMSFCKKVTEGDIINKSFAYMIMLINISFTLQPALYGPLYQ
jgi:hypothetical protein